MKLFSPAKVNLLLNVRHKRKDGYHELETIFERVDLCDELHLEPAKEGIRLKVTGIQVPSDGSNLVVRAAELLQKKYHVKKGVRMRLHKRIPVSAGLGGGSSNAASALIGLNSLWRLGLSQKKLLTLAAELGSDVPFFVLETPFALGRGRGEKLQELPFGGRPIWHVLVKPRFGISTREAYEALGGRSLTLPGADVKMLLHSIRNGDTRALASRLFNSLEVALNKRVTTIEKIKESLLNEGALGALLSGSGSCVFGVFLSQGAALKAAGRLKRKGKVFVVSTV